MKVEFDLQKPEFTSDDSDDEIKMPYQDLIRMYNKEYSVMVAETKKFYTQCKETISKVVQIGAGFNMPFLLNKILIMENSNMNPKIVKQDWSLKKPKYEQNFHLLLNRMGNLIEDFMQFEIDIKMAYLGQEVKSPPRNKKKLSVACSPSKGMASDKKSEHSQTPAQKDEDKSENILRGILHRNMIPLEQEEDKVCRMHYQPMKNLDFLLEKTEKMRKKIGMNKLKEQKIWDIFNQKRPSGRNVLPENESPRKQQFQKINELLHGIVQHRKNSWGNTKQNETAETSLN